MTQVAPVQHLPVGHARRFALSRQPGTSRALAQLLDRSADLEEKIGSLLAIMAIKTPADCRSKRVEMAWMRLRLVELRNLLGVEAQNLTEPDTRVVSGTLQFSDEPQ